MSVRRAIGLMSGTSMDGVDVAFIETDGHDIVVPGPTGFRPYHEDERAVLRAALAAAPLITGRDDRPPALAEAEAVVGAAHLAAVESFLAAYAIPADSVDVIGFHGQTVFHAPERGLTVQLGDGEALATGVGIPVVYDMRAADVAAGGQGAPLVPVYHRALANAVGIELPLAVLNLGGVANLTLIDAHGGLVAFDTGPANALLDDLMLERTGHARDEDGATAAGGSVDAAALARLMDHPYFARPLPKSLDRNAFSRAVVDALPPADAAATLTAFTAAAVARGLAIADAPPGRIVACGGGARNPTMLAAIAALTGREVVPASELGWRGDTIEAEAFAYLAVRALDSLPLTFPGTTGVAAPKTGGRLAVPGASAGG